MLTELQVDGSWEGLQTGYRAISESTIGPRSVGLPSGVPGLWQRGTGVESQVTSVSMARNRFYVPIN